MFRFTDKGAFLNGPGNKPVDTQFLLDYCTKPEDDITSKFLYNEESDSQSSMTQAFENCRERMRAARDEEERQKAERRLLIPVITFEMLKTKVSKDPADYEQTVGWAENPLTPEE